MANRSRPAIVKSIFESHRGCCMRVLAAIVLALPLMAQIEQGSLVGIIVDPQKAPVAGAVVTFRSLTTNVQREALSSSSGEYNSLPLQPGRYSVSVRQSGFREQRTDVTLGVGQRLQL